MIPRGNEFWNDSRKNLELLRMRLIRQWIEFVALGDGNGWLLRRLLRLS
jgi:hypothetical protein